MLFTIITRSGAGLHITARSLSVQVGSDAFEWFVIGDVSDPRVATAGVPFTAVSSRAEAVARASGRYVWFLDAPSCIADMYVLRDVASAVRSALGPQFLFADTRFDGHIVRARDTDHLPRGPITAMGAQIFDRKILTPDIMTVHESDDYALTLHATATATRAHYLSRIICDAPDKTDNPMALYVTRATFVSKPVNRVLYWRDHYAARLKSTRPRLYWALRNIIIPPYRRRSMAEFRRDNPAFAPKPLFRKRQK